MKIILATLVIFGLSAQAHAKNLMISIKGLDCVTCQPKVEKAFKGVKGVQSAKVSTPAGAACVETNEDFSADIETFQSSLSHMPEYTVTKVAVIQTCPLDKDKRRPGRLWSKLEGIDAKIISTREEIDLQSSTEKNKFTIIDFGADWCGPCRVAEKKLRALLEEHADVAVRAIAMDGDTPKETFALPVAQQHLKNAPGIPYFFVFSPTGKQIYKGPNIDKAIAIVNKRRKR